MRKVKKSGKGKATTPQLITVSGGVVRTQKPKVRWYLVDPISETSFAFNEKFYTTQAAAARAAEAIYKRRLKNGTNGPCPIVIMITTMT